jgi:uncharacterized protein with HEPN domain
VSRREELRLRDIREACLAISRHLERRAIAGDEVVFDAIRVRLIEIGEAVKDLSAVSRASEPGIPWADIAGMRDLLAHRYFDTSHAIVQTTAETEVPALLSATERLLARND